MSVEALEYLTENGLSLSQGAFKPKPLAASITTVSSDVLVVANLNLMLFLAAILTLPVTVAVDPSALIKVSLLIVAKDGMIVRVSNSAVANVKL